MARVVGLLGPVAVLAIVLAACGGGEPTPTTPALTPTATPVRPAPTTAAAPTTTPATAGAPTAAPTTAAAPAPTPTTAPLPTPTSIPTSIPRTPPLTGPRPRYGGVLNVRLLRYPPNWDTHHAQGGSWHPPFQQILNHLIRYKWDSVSEIEGDLAESWEVGADGRTYTFKLRRDAKWQDGKPFTSADVAYNFRHAADPQYTWNAQRVAAVGNLEGPDSSTFKVVLKRSSAPFIPNIASAFFLIYPSHLDPAAWQRSPVGTGAHKFKGAVSGEIIEFARNPEYFRKDAAGRSLPYLDGLIYYVIPAPGLALAAFRTGKVHCGCAYDSDYMTDNEDLLRRTMPGVKLGRHAAGFRGLMFNLKRAPFDNVAFRQAVGIGLDKQALVNTAYEGRALYPVPLFVIPTERGGQWGLPKEELLKVPGLNPDHAKDVAIAQQKFRESGIDPRTVSVGLLAALAGAARYDSDALASILTTTLGLKTNVIGVESVELNSRLMAGNFDFNLVSRSPSLDDPSEWLTAHTQTGAAFNFGGYSNPRADEQLIAQDAEVDPAKRRAIVWEAQRTILGDMYIMPIAALLEVHGTKAEVIGYTSARPLTHSNMRLDLVWLDA